MDDVRYRVSDERANSRAYRQFFGKEARSPWLEGSFTKSRIKLVLLHARAFIQGKAGKARRDQ